MQNTESCIKEPTSDTVQPSENIPKEFVIIAALLVSLTALAIDTMLPALPQIAADLGVVESNDRQLVLSVLFLGMAIGQLLYGPISDVTGRRPMVMIGLALFIAGSLLVVVSTSFYAVLLGRFIQGLGAAGPRTLMVAIIRDRYVGNVMAKMTSLVMMVFITVPVLAPIIGQGILTIGSWRLIFWLFAALGLITSLWYWFRLPETLAPENRKTLSFHTMLGAFREVITNRFSASYTLCISLVFGAFIGYLSSSQQILQEQYQTGEYFAFYFSALALGIGFAAFVNSKLVMRFSLINLCRCALGFIVIAATGLWVLMAFRNPSLAELMGVFLPIFFCFGLLFGNLNAMAMQPMGHIAGMAAAVIGFISTGISLVLGYSIGQAYDGTLYPLILSFILCFGLALVILQWAGRTPQSR